MKFIHPRGTLPSLVTYSNVRAAIFSSVTKIQNIVGFFYHVMLPPRYSMNNSRTWSGAKLQLCYEQSCRFISDCGKPFTPKATVASEMFIKVPSVLRSNKVCGRWLEIQVEVCTRKERFAVMLRVKLKQGS